MNFYDLKLVVVLMTNKELQLAKMNDCLLIFDSCDSVKCRFTTTDSTIEVTTSSDIVYVTEISKQNETKVIAKGRIENKNIYIPCPIYDLMDSTYSCDCEKVE